MSCNDTQVKERKKAKDMLVVREAQRCYFEELLGLTPIKKKKLIMRLNQLLEPNSFPTPYHVVPIEFRELTNQQMSYYRKDVFNHVCHYGVSQFHYNEERWTLRVIYQYKDLNKIVMKKKTSTFCTTLTICVIDYKVHESSPSLI